MAQATDSCVQLCRTTFPVRRRCLCNGIETCDVELGCQAGDAARVQTTGSPARIDACDEATDSFSNAPERQRSATTPMFCTGTETCDAVLDCQAGTPLDSDDDGVACTDDSCDPDHRQLWRHVPNDSSC